jgi:long-subunit fatty acid transport protein
MKFSKIVSASLALTLGWGGTVFAQNETDALRYTRYGLTGSARIQGIGGAQTALGADISTIATNPAGLGMFRRSEFSFSLGQQSVNAGTFSNVGQASDQESRFVIPQMGVVLPSRNPGSEDSNWKGITFGIGFTRLNNFNETFSYQNTSTPPNTIVDYFADLANSRVLRPGETLLSNLDAEFDAGIQTLSGLAYGTYLIDVFQDNSGNQFAEGLYTFGNSNQQERVQRSGSQSQIDIGAGTSYKDKIYLGASMGIVTTDFRQESLFQESGNYVATFDEAGNPDVEGPYSLALRDEFRSRGTGINLKLGVIARPTDALRLGLSLQTPTVHRFSDSYQSAMSATTLSPTTLQPETFTESTFPGEFDYRLTTPLRATGGVAFFINKYGFVSADLEYVNYTGMRYSERDNRGSSSDYFTNVNNNISDTFQSAINYRIGAEGRYEVFRVRAGYARTGDPYSSSDVDGSISSYTLGAGVRLRNYYVDLAYVNSRMESPYSPYVFSSGGGEPIIDIENKMNTVMLTLGYNF